MKLVENSVCLHPAALAIHISPVRTQGGRFRGRGKGCQISGPQTPRPIGEPYRLQRRDERAAHDSDTRYRCGGARQYLGNPEHVLQRFVLMASRPILSTFENLREGLGHQLPE